MVCQVLEYGVIKMFKNKKTYILGGVAIIGAIAGYLVGDLELAAAIQLIVTAGLGMTVRAGIGKKV